MLPQLAEGDANKVFVVPSEFAAGVRRHRRGAGARRCRRRTAAHAPRAPTPPPAPARPPAGLRADRRAPRLTCGCQNQARDVRLARREAAGHARRRPPARHADRAGHRRGDARDPPRAARGGRQLQGRQAVHRPAEGALPRRRRGRQAQPRPAGREDRRRGADRADGRRVGRPELLAAAADGDPDGRAAGLGQDDRDGQARALPARGALLDGRAWRPATSTARRPSSSSSRSARRPGAEVYEQGTDRDPVEIAAWALERAHERGQGRADRRHQRAPARRRGADGRARAHPRRGQTARHPARRRRDDRPGRGQRRRELRRGGAVRRRA